ncbi:MAG: secretin and TonB N-terminal domain-containing protein [Planctomycetota bacterium]|nr:MAG: secretin and TonB N-terminal domain-containing protein [Planctomycetota bacterium]
MSSLTKFRITGFLVILACVAVLCTFAFAEDAADDSGPKEVLTTLEQRMLKKISIDFRNTPIEDVIRIMAEQADVDIVKSPKVTGNVTATLTNVPLAEALDNILAAHGYGYVAGKNMIRIAPVEEITEKAERLDSKIYHITYADAAGVEKALKKFISSRGSLSSSPGTSHIIVTDTETNIKAIDTFIAEIDRITPQVLIETRIYDITSRDKLDLGVEWDVGRRTTYDADTGEPISGKIDPFITGVFDAGTNKTEATTNGFIRFGLLNKNIDLDVQLRAEQENIDAKLLANPRILVLDNETATFDIVTEQPYVERTIQNGITTETVKFKDIGTKLQVTPHVTRDGMLRLHIVPEFGIQVARVITETINVPVVDTRRVNTIALVRDGQTVVLGGLRKKDVSKQINKVPLLGDIPVLGAAFRFEGEDTAVTEIVVFITPQIIQQAVLSDGEQRAYEMTEFGIPEVGMTKAEEKASEE